MCTMHNDGMQHSSPSEAYRGSGTTNTDSLEPEVLHLFHKTDLCPKTDKSSPNTHTATFFFKNSISVPTLIALKRSCPTTPCTTLAASALFIPFARRFLISSPQINLFDYQKGTDIQTVCFSDQHNTQITEILRQVHLYGVLTKNIYLVSRLLVVILSYIFPFL